jgi:hypothetical protein
MFLWDLSELRRNGNENLHRLSRQSRTFSALLKTLSKNAGAQPRMTMPGFNAEASLYATSQHYSFAGVRAAGRFDSILAQQGCRHLGQFCAGLELSCCPGLRCTGRLGPGICVPCPPCEGGCQIDPSSPTGCSQVCYFSGPFGLFCIPRNVPCDQPTCCALLMKSCIAGGESITDCSKLSGGCDSCPPCCFKCGVG